MATVSIVEGGGVTAPAGFRAGAVCAGMYAAGPKAGALDLAILVSDRPCHAAAVFTRNLVKGAPVVLSQERISGGCVRAVVANSGCSNSLNGPGGYDDARLMTELAAAHCGLKAEEFAVASTGVTGTRMPMDKVTAGISRIVLKPDGGHEFALAIMTTDTRPKEVAVRVETPSGHYHIGGCAKGSGMIHPDMATMLAYVTTDADVEPGFLAAAHRRVADATLNMVSVDGDTSCSDTFIILANGAASLPRIEAGTPEAEAFEGALLRVATHLAREIARDGEGAGRLMEVAVTGAASLEDARRVARTITTSPLVKTAIAGCDPNWGRILVAAGRAGARLEEAKCTLMLQGRLLFERGAAVPFQEAEMRKYLDAPEVRIELDLGLGESSATAWGCDLTTEYVHINADYTT
ncbi:MAG TPA: bifunctional glutamate N-acetyltransferase/amino-acid acetyltransferase ArgJ [Dehalococcoidia bacterium]|nr:bifunctional glutamate N-acetyltransferase/amino-acid acetyltransferase ArgJ [Dehalococcoidia bacterium]